MSVEYPASLPVESVSEIIRIVRAQSFVAERAALALHGWNVQGYLQKVLLGEPSPLIGDALIVAMNDEQACEFLDEHAKARDAVFAGAAPEKIDPTKIVAFLKWLLPLILPLILDK